MKVKFISKSVGIKLIPLSSTYEYKNGFFLLWQKSKKFLQNWQRKTNLYQIGGLVI